MGYVEGLLAKNEQIVIKTRQHWRVLVGSAFANGLLFIILLALGIAFQTLPVLQRFRIGIVVLAFFIFAIFPILAFVRDFLEWWNEDFIVTNRRVIQAQGILGKHVLDSSLDKVNDVLLTQSFLGRMFDYGDLEIDTANANEPNIFRTIAEPVKFKMAMMNQREAMTGGQDQSARTDAADIGELMKELNELHQQGVLTDQEFQEKKRELLGRMKVN